MEFHRISSKSSFISSFLISCFLATTTAICRLRWRCRSRMVYAMITRRFTFITYLRMIAQQRFTYDAAVERFSVRGGCGCRMILVKRRLRLSNDFTRRLSNDFTRRLAEDWITLRRPFAMRLSNGLRGSCRMIYKAGVE